MYKINIYKNSKYKNLVSNDEENLPTGFVKNPKSKIESTCAYDIRTNAKKLKMIKMKEIKEGND